MRGRGGGQGSNSEATESIHRGKEVGLSQACEEVESVR